MTALLSDCTCWLLMVPITTPVRQVDNTCRDSFDLFYALYSHNPASSDQLQQFAEAFDEVRTDLLGFTPASGSAGAGADAKARVQLSRRVRGMALSKTVAVTDKAAALRRQGIQVISSHQ